VIDHDVTIGEYPADDRDMGARIRLVALYNKHGSLGRGAGARVAACCLTPPGVGVAKNLNAGMGAGIGNALQLGAGVNDARRDGIQRR
jgi:hypothetical protein